MNIIYKCEKCGLEFDESEIEHAREYVGECCGSSAYESAGKCPRCRSSNIYEMCECEICGELDYVEEMINCVCKNCLKNHEYDWEFCKKIGECPSSLCIVKVNSFFASIFSEDEINEILEEHLSELAKHKSIDCKEFINEDKWFFAESLKEQEKSK